MSAFDQALAAMPVAAILRGLSPDECLAIGEAIIRAGITILEVPLNSPDPLTSIRRMAEAFDGRALVGAGTVLGVEAVDQVAEAGGSLIISPNTDTAVIGRTKALGLVSLPGFFTPSEAFAALGAGADALKLFPAEMAPPSSLRAIRAVLPANTRVMIVGGVSPQTIPPYLAAGAAGFGVGSDLYKPGRGADEVGERARALAAAVRQAREVRS